MLPSTILAIICGPSNCGKTNVLISLLKSPERERYTFRERVHLFKIVATVKVYRYLENLFTFIDKICYFTFSNSDVVPPSEARQILFLSLMTWHATSRMR